MTTCSRCDTEVKRAGYCRPCANAYNREWLKRNPGYSTKAKLRWLKANPEKRREIDRRKYRRKMIKKFGPDWTPRVRADLSGMSKEDRRKRRNRQFYESAKRRAKKNPEYAKARNAARHATQRSKAVAGRFSRRDVLAMLENQGGRCRLCPSDISKSYHVDHKKPLANGGGNTVSNIKLLCPRCNLKKGAKCL